MKIEVYFMIMNKSRQKQVQHTQIWIRINIFIIRSLSLTKHLTQRNIKIIAYINWPLNANKLINCHLQSTMINSEGWPDRCSYVNHNKLQDKNPRTYPCSKIAWYNLLNINESIIKSNLNPSRPSVRVDCFDAAMTSMRNLKTSLL